MGILADAPLITTPALPDVMWVHHIGTPTTPDKSMEMTALGDLYLRSDVFMVDASFANLDATWGRFTTISAALAACSGGETIHIAPGIYTETCTVADNYIKLRGSGAPAYDSGTGRLVGGTIIRGSITMSTYVGVEVHDLGVDLYGVNSTNCINASTSGVNSYRTYKNLTLLGNGVAAGAHGIYAAGHYHQIQNIRIYKCTHGIAVHGSYTNISDIYLYSCNSSAIIFKAKSSINVVHCNASNIVIEGDPASTSVRAGPLIIQTEDSCEARRINISNVTARYCYYGVIFMNRNDTTGTISEISCTNIASDGNNQTADFWIISGNNILLSNCRSTNRVAGFGFYRDGADNVGAVSVLASYADATGAGASNGSFTTLQLQGSTPTFPGVTVTGGPLILTAAGTLTIASGVITVTGSNHNVDTEAAAATDDLDTINGGVVGQILILKTSNSAHDVTVKNNTGNIDCGSDRVLDANRDTIMLMYGTGSRWQALSFISNL